MDKSSKDKYLKQYEDSFVRSKIVLASRIVGMIAFFLGALTAIGLVGSFLEEMPDYYEIDRDFWMILAVAAAFMVSGCVVKIVLDGFAEFVHSSNITAKMSIIQTQIMIEKETGAEIAYTRSMAENISAHGEHFEGPVSGGRMRPIETDTGWICICGQQNDLKSDACKYCGVKRWNIK